MSVVSSPIQIPIIQPTDWEKWWDLWFKESASVQKISKNHNQYPAPWRGFDIWVRDKIDAETTTQYRAKNVNCPELFPSIFDNLDMFPINIDIVRVVSSMGHVAPHHDSPDESLSVRSLIYDNNIKSTFYYQANNDKIYQKLPPTTNTWMYWDHKLKHGTDYYFGHSKILITYFGTMKPDFSIAEFNKSAELFSEYVVTTE
jgi:hypothetical protein